VGGSAARFDGRSGNVEVETLEGEKTHEARDGLFQVERFLSRNLI